MIIALEDNGIKQKQVMIYGLWGRTSGTIYQTFNYLLTTLVFPDDSINKIRIISSVNKGIVKGTKLKMWKVV